MMILTMEVLLIHHLNGVRAIPQLRHVEAVEARGREKEEEEGDIYPHPSDPLLLSPIVIITIIVLKWGRKANIAQGSTATVAAGVKVVSSIMLLHVPLVVVIVWLGQVALAPSGREE